MTVLQAVKHLSWIYIRIIQKSRLSQPLRFFGEFIGLVVNHSIWTLVKGAYCFILLWGDNLG